MLKVPERRASVSGRKRQSRYSIRLDGTIPTHRSFPWEWWADATPEKKTSFRLPTDYTDIQFPSVEYRGIFINDEDWGLMPWSSLTHEPWYKPGRIGPRTHERNFLSCCSVCELTLIGLPCTNAQSLFS